MRIFLLFILTFTLSQTLKAQLKTDHFPHESDLVRKITGNSVKISNITYTGAFEARGLFESKGTPLPFSSGIILSTGDIKMAKGPNLIEARTGINRTKGDNDLFKYARTRTFDAAVLEFDFVPDNSVLQFNFVFGSEEYLEYVNSGYNDIFAFFVTDLTTKKVRNIGVIPGTNTPITINNVNTDRNSKYFVNNSVKFQRSAPDSLTLEFDGFTKKLIAYQQVIPGRKYHIKISISDVGDSRFDSAVFIEGGSFKSTSSEDFVSENTDFLKDFKVNTTTFVPEETVANEKVEPTVENEQEEATTEKEKVVPDEQPTVTTQPVEKVKEKPETNESFPPLVLHFAHDIHQLSDEATLLLNNYLQQLKGLNKEYSVSVIGHTDNSGTHAYNKVLSNKRAQTVTWQLQQAGISSKLISSEGKSYDQPIDNNNSEKGKAQNRRVEISVKIIP